MKNNEDNEMNRIKNNDYIFFVFVNMKNVSFYRVKKREERKKETYVTYIQNNNNIGYISKKINGIQWIRKNEKKRSSTLTTATIISFFISIPFPLTQTFNLCRKNKK